ncbi:MAG: trigger factor [Lentisphaerae bacterium]|nr:trigger factor [Lentisphaerota bacterium]
MNVSVNDAGTCRKKMTIDVPSEEIAKEREETLKAYMRYANIPGFRKGKAPKSVVAKKYAQDIDKDLQERVLPKYYHEAVKEAGLKVVNIIDVTDVIIEDEKPVLFDVTVDVEPEFSLPKYTEIPVKEEKVVITDKQVQEYLDGLLRQHANYEEVDGKAVAEGDMAQLTYEATVDGQPLQEVIPEAKGIGSGEGYWVSADDYAFIPGMGKAIVGLNKGDKKEVEVAFPDTFMVKELAGVKALYQIEVTAVRELKIPEIDAELCKKLGVEDEADLRQKIREQLETNSEYAALNKMHQQIVQYLLEKTEIEVPDSLVQQQARNMMNDIARQRMMGGMSEEQLAEQQMEILEEAKERALDNVKIRYIGLAIADELEYTASANEISEEIASIAIQQRRDAREVRKEMEENGTLDSVGEQIRFNKAIDYMFENAKIQ